MRNRCVKVLFLLIIGLMATPFLYFNDINYTEVTHIRKTAYQPTLEVKGVIESAKSNAVKLSYPVYIKKSYVCEDSYVNKGQLLFELDIEKMGEYVNDISFTEYEKYNIPLKEDMIFDISREIYATDSGYIRDLSAVDGALVLSGENMCVIESDSSNILKLTLSQEDYSRVSVGDTIKFSPDISPNRKYTAAVNSKTAHIKKETSITGKKTVVEIYADIYDTDDFILSGLEITGTLVKPQKQISVLPYEYVNQDDNGEFVTVFANGKYLKEYVNTGTETHSTIEILDSFAPDTLFVKNNYKDKGISLLKYED